MHIDIDIKQLQQTFFQDAEEHLEEIDAALTRISPEEDCAETISEVFRSVHTLKGDSGAVGFDEIQSLLHHFETHLDLLRDGKVELTANSTDIFAMTVDCVEQLILAAREGTDPPLGLDAVVSLLDELNQAAKIGESKAVKEEQPCDFGLFEDTQEVTSSSSLEITTSIKSAKPFFGDYLLSLGMLTDAQLREALDKQHRGQPNIGSLLLKSGSMSMKDVDKTLFYQGDVGQLFGETAVQLGLLQESALNDALAEQRRLRPSLRRTLVELGYFDEQTIAKQFSAFSEEFPEAISTNENEDSSNKSNNQSGEQSSSESTEFECDEQLLAEFISDSEEHLSNAEEQLLVIENDPNNTEALNAIYRAFHTLKGLSSFLGLDDTRNLAHQAESMLNLARDSQLTLSGDALEVALASVDGLKLQVSFAREWLETRGKLQVDPQLPGILEAIDSVVHGQKPQSLAKETKTEPIKETPVDKPAVDKSSAKRIAKPTQVKETIKVDRDRLDKLINVIGELVIGQAMMEQEVNEWQQALGCESFAITQLHKTVRDLQELSLSLRMIPIGSVFHKMARIVRDLGRKLNKEIRFETEGDETELDKTVVDQIGDPLLHMVRNAADHGIEMPEDRIAAGKNSQGSIVLRAYHQGGNIYIEISDDGKGLDSQALLNKAIERGIVNPGDSLTEQEIHNLIFAPGFSTAKEVTDVSGRGVGMDVVRRNVEALQGSVSVRSVKGEGSTVVIRLPLTLAILDGLSIRLGDDVFIVPILSVVESFSPLKNDIKIVGGKGEVVIVREEVVPLLRLNQLLGIKDSHQEQPGEPLVVIVEDHGKKFALLVDELLGQSQVVIKNLETNYKKVEGLAGATILGDGRIAMILDVFGLVCMAREQSTESPFEKNNIQESIEI